MLDTSVFTNPSTGKRWGEKVASALATFVDLGRRAGDRLQFFMPPSILEEVKTFLGGEELPPDFELVVSLRAPDRYGTAVPGFLLYELIEDIRARIDRGLRVAEKAVREAGPANLDRTITRLREHYRAVLRSGLLDSKEDVDLILLARELDAALVSSDQAVVTWAETLGVRLIEPAQLRQVVESVIARE